MEIESRPISYNVRIGTWVNWSRGRVFGSTLTLTRANGNLVIAFTAFFVAFVSSRFWRIACISFHRYYSTSKPKDALHHQRQVILRNSATPEAGLWTLWTLILAWRHLARRPISRILPAFVSAALCISAFAVAGGFSSQISTGIGNEVLVNGTNCALVDEETNLLSNVALFFGSQTRRISNAANYARQCYNTAASGTNDSPMFDCNSFVTNRLPGSVNTEARCPFKDGICRSNSSNLFMDTGFIDSHKHLGINAPPDARILFREVSHCAPLHTRGFNGTVTGDEEEYTAYYYGSSPNISRFATEWENRTLMVPNLKSQYMRQLDNSDRNVGVTYRLIRLTATISRGVVQRRSSSFKPIPSLQRLDGDVSIIFLIGNGVSFLAPVNDPWYRGTVSTGPDAGAHEPNSKQGVSIYSPEDAASPMGCVEQYQFCRSESQCGPLASRVDALYGAAPLFDLRPRDLNQVKAGNTSTGSKFNWFVRTFGFLSPSGPSGIVIFSGADVLLSQQTLRAGLQAPLPDDQWKRDVTHFWNTWLATLQVGFVELANRRHDPAFDQFLIPPADQYQRDMCYNQKIQSRQHTSFSMFGLCFVLMTGIVIAIMSYILEPLFSWLDNKRHTASGHRKDVEWTTNEMVHLQSLGFKGLGRGTWSHFYDNIPVTEAHELLDPLLFEHDVVEKHGESATSVTEVEDHHPVSAGNEDTVHAIRAN
ncbi:hypothetical protein B0H63DRAFT_185332 [Podospora didyma]|uniref:Uncharacterized protein n=1 Tax=Podospora didyma TaxID=330526 RepID=A0AAE0NQ53_9PEZI|nr:hypothetical protein B0H63DRAFT_185332 [Podospora didyma]